MLAGATREGGGGTSRREEPALSEGKGEEVALLLHGASYSLYLVLTVYSCYVCRYMCQCVSPLLSVKGPVNVYVSVSSVKSVLCLFASSCSHSKGIHCPLLQIHIRSEFAGTGDTCPSSLAVHGPVGWDGRDCLWREMIIVFFVQWVNNCHCALYVFGEYKNSHTPKVFVLMHFLIYLTVLLCYIRNCGQCACVEVICQCVFYIAEDVDSATCHPVTGRLQMCTFPANW